MPLVASVDYPNKRIYLSASTADTNLDTLAVYREVRALRRTNVAHRAFRPMIVAGGNIEKIAGVSYTPAYVRLLYGCRIVPYNASHSLRLIRDTFTDDGMAGRDCFDRTPLGAMVEVNIDVDFPEIEIRTVAVSGPTSSEIANAVWSHATGSLVAVRMAEAWGRLGLDASKPLVSGQTEITFGDIVMALTGNEVTSTLTRQ